MEKEEGNAEEGKKFAYRLTEATSPRCTKRRNFRSASVSTMSDGASTMSTNGSELCREGNQGRHTPYLHASPTFAEHQQTSSQRQAQHAHSSRIHQSSSIISFTISTSMSIPPWQSHLFTRYYFIASPLCFHHFFHLIFHHDSLMSVLFNLHQRTPTNVPDSSTSRHTCLPLVYLLFHFSIITSASLHHFFHHDSLMSVSSSTCINGLSQTYLTSTSR